MGTLDSSMVKKTAADLEVKGRIPVFTRGLLLAVRERMLQFYSDYQHTGIGCYTSSW